MKWKRGSSVGRLKRKAGTLPLGVSLSKQARISGRHSPSHTRRSDSDIPVLRGQGLVVNGPCHNKRRGVSDHEEARNSDEASHPRGATNLPVLFDEEANGNVDEVSRSRSPSKPYVLFDDDEDCRVHEASSSQGRSGLSVPFSSEGGGDAGEAHHLRSASNLHIPADIEENVNIDRPRRPRRLPVLFSDEGDGEADKAHYPRRQCRRRLRVLIDSDEDCYENDADAEDEGIGFGPEGAEVGCDENAPSADPNVRRVVEMEAQETDNGGNSDDEDGRNDHWDNDEESVQVREDDEEGSYPNLEVFQQAKLTGILPNSDDIEAALRAIERSHDRRLSIQREVLQARRGLSGSVLRQRDTPVAHAGVYQTAKGYAVNDLEGNRERIRASWLEYIEQLPNDFFNPQNLFRLRRDDVNVNWQDSSRNRRLFVAALALNENNNLDMLRIYSQRCENRINCGMSVGAYQNLRSTVGQYCRVYLTFQPQHRATFFEQGSIFMALRNYRLLRLYLDKYKIDAAPNTVNQKANHLITAARIALEFYASENKQQEKGEIRLILSHLHSTSSTFKWEGRLERRRKNTVEAKMNSGKFLLRDDFENCVNIAENQLVHVMNDLGGRNMPTQPLRQLARHHKTLDKWFLNLSALLIFVAGGQRPQVYCHLLVPDEADLIEIERDPHQQYIELQVDFEKVPRSHVMPNVLLPRSMIKYLLFHVNQMLPWFMVLHGMDLRHAPRRLLLHTRTGKVLSSSQVARTLRVFIEGYDPELSTITPMAIRGSYAKIMMQRHLRGEIFADKTEGAFLDFLAKSMNTSTEQLGTTYAAAKTKDFHDVANELVSGLMREENEASKFPHRSH